MIAVIKLRIAMEHIQFFTIITTVLGSAYFIHRDIRDDIKQANTRTDRLYEMFIDLLKHKKQD